MIHRKRKKTHRNSLEGDWIRKMLCGGFIFAVILMLIGCPIYDWLKNVIIQGFRGICMWIEDENNTNYIEVLNIIVSLVTLLGVALLTVKATTYVYNMQKEDEKKQIQDELHLILNEMGKNMKTLHHLAMAVHQFDEECQRKISNRDAIRKAVELWKRFDVIRAEEDYLANYHRFYHIFAKEEEIEFRTGDPVRLSDLEEVISGLQLQIECQYYMALELKRKMNTLQNLFEDNACQSLGKARQGSWREHRLHEKNKDADKGMDNSTVKRIDRTLRNEGMNVDILRDEMLNAVSFTYRERNSFQREMIDYERSTIRLMDQIRSCTAFPQKVRDKYFM